MLLIRSLSAMIKDQIKKLPAKPGVYQFLDKDGRIVYIGKAKDIKKRVTQHFQGSKNAPAKNKKMLTLVETITCIETGNEIEALILESTLIKEHHPKYNILLRDDANFLYVKITFGDEYPRIFFVRRMTEHKSTYFGPYTNAGAIRQTMELINKIFPHECLKFFKTGVGTIPCFNYHIQRCPGLCIGSVGQSEYRAIMQRIARFLRGDTEEVLRDLEEKMKREAGTRNFERAAKTRDTLMNLKAVLEKQYVSDPNSTLQQDVLAYILSKDRIFVTLFKIRNGKLLERLNFRYSVPTAYEGSSEEMLATIVKEYYTSTVDIPRQIILQHLVTDKELLEGWLSGTVGNKVELLVPERGKKHYLLELCEKNAQAFADKEILKDATSQGIHPEVGLEELKELFKLKKIPKRIECYDISHLGGKFTVASMVVMKNGEPAKDHYRHFKMNTIGDQIDDYASMRETLERRLKYLVNKTLRKLTKNKKESFLEKPDLLIVDGGKGQLGVAVEVLAQLKLTGKIALAGLAKEQEDIFLPHQERPLIVDKTSQAQYLFERIRDEAHRFANSFNRRLRDKEAVVSQVDRIKGVGGATRKKLIERFGSIKQAKAASPEELEKIVGKKMAERLRETW